jgi:hypothetical protein
MSQLPVLINSFQNMNPIFQNTNNHYSFNYASVIANYNNGNMTMNTLNFTDNFNDIITHLVQITKEEFLTPIPSLMAWKGLDNCMDMIEQQQSATNLLIVFGEKGRETKWDESMLAEQAGKNNCRFLAYQMFSGDGNDFNNFALQFTDLIDASAQIVSEKKRKLIVYSNQLRENNAFKETSKNSFYLDFPERSMTQGGIYFPEKNQTIDFNQLNTSVDSFIVQIKADQNNLIESIDKAFTTVGNSKDKYDTSFLNHFDIDKSCCLKPEFKKAFKTTYTLWYQNYADTINSDSLINYQLLLSEKELENLRNIIDEIAELNVDTKIVGKKNRTKIKKSCDCPDNFFDVQIPFETGNKQPNQPEDKLITKYQSTRKSRNSFKAILKSEIYTCKYCKDKPKTKIQSLADISELIFHAPTNTKQLKEISIESLTKRYFFSRDHVLSDEDFEKLLEYYKERKSILDSEINEKISFTSSDETYYWVNCDWLP